MQQKPYISDIKQYTIRSPMQSGWSRILVVPSWSRHHCGSRGVVPKTEWGLGTYVVVDVPHQCDPRDLLRTDVYTDKG